MKNIIFLIIILFFLSNSLFGQNIKTLEAKETLEEKIDPAINQIIKSFELPGLAVGIVRDNEIVYAKGYGVKDIKSKDPITYESLFHMASVSKPFVATAIVQLMEKGKININEPVVKYLPYFKIDDDKYKEITIQQMLSHTSGMSDTDDYGWSNPEFDDGAAERYVKSLVHERLLFEPGTDWAYSNIAFEVLGDVIAKISNMSFEDYVKKNILNPIGMNNSTFLKTEVSTKLNTTPHIRVYNTEVSKIYPYNRAHAPSSTLHSSVSEMCKWAMVNLNRGVINNKRILRQESYDLLWKQYTRGIGLSWFMGRFNMNRTIRHGGGDTGYATEFVMLPEKNIAVVVFANCDYAPVWEISRIILGIIFDQEYDIPLTPVFIPLSKLMKVNNITEVVKLYHNLKKKHIHDYNFDEEQLGYFGSSLLTSGKVDQAIEIFKLNVESYPNSSDTYYNLGKAYMKAGNKRFAVNNLTKALGLDSNNVYAKRLLSKLH